MCPLSHAVAPAAGALQRYVETLGGNIEKDVDGKELKFYIPSTVGAGTGAGPDARPLAATATAAGAGVGAGARGEGDVDDAATDGLSRAFVHPTSVNFSNTAYRPSNFVLYGERQLSVQLGGANRYTHTHLPLCTCPRPSYDLTSPHPVLYMCVLCVLAIARGPRSAHTSGT